MELLGAMSSREWNSLGGFFSSENQEPNHYDHDHQSLMAEQNILENIGASSLEFPFSTNDIENYSYALHNQDNYSDFYLNNECDHDLDLDHQCLKQDIVNNDHIALETESPPRSSKKRFSRDYDQGQKSKRNVKPRKSKKLASSDEEQEDDCSAALNLNGKARASRGSAIDPQSIYARKRREKINERLRVLQNLVPNGTKVDISTMLDEAVRYVKFLQFQIKLLSSEDMWMYAPLAYNGMNVGIDLSDLSFCHSKETFQHKLL